MQPDEQSHAVGEQKQILKLEKNDSYYDFGYKEPRHSETIVAKKRHHYRNSRF